MTTRPYKEVPIRAIGAQHTRTRFQGQWDRSYLISRWRGNLTALSQKHNLYFVCCRERIQVYQPAFPDQALPLKPSFVIEPPVSDQELSGYLDQGVPHSINRVLVDFLGNQEVLIVACDDGDVIGFFTDSIQHIATRRARHDPATGSLADDVRPFFHVNVGKSAWGLAVHQEARKLAVSCNTRQVTIFDFALTNEVYQDEGMAYGDSSETESGAMKIPLPEADQNIPHVSFCNTGDDPDGRFLLATDIIGNMIMYDIDQRTVVRSIRCAYCKTGPAADHRCLCADKSHYPHALWGAYWLDRRSFSRQPDVRAATGLSDLSSSHLSKSWALDISRTTPEVCNSSLEYIPSQGTPDETWHRDVEEDDDLGAFEEDVNIEEEASLVEDLEEVEMLDVSPDQSSPTQAAQAQATTTLSSGSTSPSADDTGGDEPPTQTGAPVITASAPTLTLMQQLEAATASSGAFWTGFHPPQQALRPEIQAIVRRPKRLHYTAKPSHKEQATYFSSPACPILQLSIKDITLFQPRDHDHDVAHEEGRNPHAGAMPPAVFLHDPLWQRIPATTENPFYNSDHLGRMSRFSLVAQIPTIGVVLAGSPFGRVAVLSLAQTQVNLPSPHASPRPASRASGRGRAVKSFYSLRLDHILPFRSQEKKGDRPERLLLGLSVSPVQGMLGRKEEDVSRWRVLLMYEDQSVLSYEISRPRRGGGRSGLLVV